MSRLGILEKGGHDRLRSFEDFYRIYYGDDVINRKPVAFEFEVPRMTSDVYHPSILKIHNAAEFTSNKKVQDLKVYTHQVLTQTAFAQVDPLETGEGFTIRSWKNLDGPPSQAHKGAFYDTPTGRPLSIVKFEKPTTPVPGTGLNIYFTENFGVASSYRYVEQHVYNTVEDTLVVTTYANHDVGQADKIIKRETLDYDRESQIVGGSANNPELIVKKWKYSLTRTVQEAGNNPDGEIGPLFTVSRTREEYSDVSKSEAGGEFGMRRLLRKIDDYGGANLETKYTYFNDRDNDFVHGRLKSVTRPDGSWTYYGVTDSRTSLSPQTVTYSSYLNRTIDQRHQAKKVVTEYEPDTVTQTTFLNGVQVAKSVISISKLPNGDRRLLEQQWTGTDYATTTTVFHKHEGTGIRNGRRAWRKHADGTYTIWGYLGTEEMLKVIERTGAGDSTNITSGTKTVTSYNAAYQPIDVQVYDIQLGENEGDEEIQTLIASRTTVGVTGGAVDPQGRHTKWQHFEGADAYFTTTQYGCCGPEMMIDRSGAKKLYFRDALRRVYKTTTQRSTNGPLITATTITNGLVSTRSQEAGGKTIFLGRVARSLSGLSRTIQSPDADGDGNPETTTTITTYTNSSTSGNPSGTLQTTTHPDLTTTKRKTLLDGRLSATVDQENIVTSYVYSTHNEQGGGETRTVKLPGSSESTTSYMDQLGRVFKMKYADDAVSTRTYYPYHKVVSMSPAGSRGRLQSVTDADDVTVRYTYNPKGERITTTTPLPDHPVHGAQSRVTFSETNVVPSVTLHGTTIAPAFETISQVNGVITSRTYRSIDGRRNGSLSFGREVLSETTVPNDGAWVSTSITADGQKTIQTYSDGLLQTNASFTNEGTAAANSITSMSYAYDPFGRVLSQTDARTGLVTYDSDADSFPEITDSGNLLYLKDSGNRITEFTYDIMGRRTTVDAPDTAIDNGTNNNITHTSYTNRGQVKATWGAQTYPRRYEYDAQGRMTTLHTYQTAPLGEPTAPGDAVTTWVYDGQRGWLTEKNYDGETGNGPGNAADYTYTPAGRLQTRTWERGVVTTYAYTQGLLTEVTYSGETNGHLTPNLAYQYDAFGRIIEVMRNGQSHATYSYRAADLLLEKEHLGLDSFRSRKLTRKYDPLLRSVGYELWSRGGSPENLYETAYSYDAAGRFESVEYQRLPNASAPPAGQSFAYSYEAHSGSLIEKVTGPAHYVENSWEQNRDVLSQKINVVPVIGLKSCYLYEVNDIGQRTKVTQKGQAFVAQQTIDWKYNARGELVENNHSLNARDLDFSYDAIGNRLTAGIPGSQTTYVANALNQYSTITPSSQSTQSPLYDLDGNMEDDGNRFTYTWDGENRLVEVKTKPDVTPFDHRKYHYDYLGRRFKNERYTSDGSLATTQGYLYDGWNLIEVLSPSRTYGVNLVWGLDLSGRMQGAGGVGGLLLRDQTTNGSASNPDYKSYYPTYDGNGNVSEYLLADGSVALHLEYDPFGKITEKSGSESSSSWPNLYGMDALHLFSTKPKEKSTGLYYYGYRYYDPVTGRWPSRDPIGEHGGININNFLSNNPVSLHEYLGLEGETKNKAQTPTTSDLLAEFACKWRKWKKRNLQERCAAICCKEENEKVVIKKIWVNPKNFKIEGRNWCYKVNCPSGWIKVGDIHTHTYYSRTPSDKDHENKDPNVKSFLVTGYRSKCEHIISVTDFSNKPGVERFYDCEKKKWYNEKDANSECEK